MERLQKILAHGGIASRRRAEDYITSGRVRVNGRVVKELGTQVDPALDRVEVDGNVIRPEVKHYIILHKPRGYLSDRDEGQDKPTALDLVHASARLYAAGRLDWNSEGLLLLTNDGTLAHRITHPRYEHEKEYLALVEGRPTPNELDTMCQGIWYDGERLRADSVRVVRSLGPDGRGHDWGEAKSNESWLRIVLHEGKKREIRHLGSAVGHPVHRLIRTRIGPIRLGDLPVGKWRELSDREVHELLEIRELRNPITRSISREKAYLRKG